MTNTVQSGSAKIYEFPARGRFAVADRRNDAAKSPTSRAAQTACGGAWYHEEAIAEAERRRDN
jgi:Protein of unknown function (DUF2735)